MPGGADEVAATLPRGLDTPLGKEFHQGHDLSVGQWQKLAIARAYRRPAEALILDEPRERASLQACYHCGRLLPCRTQPATEPPMLVNA